MSMVNRAMGSFIGNALTKAEKNKSKKLRVQSEVKVKKKKYWTVLFFSVVQKVLKVLIFYLSFFFFLKKGAKRNTFETILVKPMSTKAIKKH